MYIKFLKSRLSKYFWKKDDLFYTKYCNLSVFINNPKLVISQVPTNKADLYCTGLLYSCLLPNIGKVLTTNTVNKANVRK